MKVKKILLIIPKKHWYFIHKIIETINNLNIDLYLIEKEGIDKFSFNFLYKIIDEKFPLYCFSPLRIINIAERSDNYCLLKTLDDHQYFDEIIDLSGSANFDFTKIAFKRILKPNIDENYWEYCTINKIPKTIVSISASTDGIVWDTIKTLSFHTEEGVYNNRDKAFFYFQYLFKNFDFNEEINPNTFHQSSKGKKKLKYYLNLVFSILKRKLNTSTLNWKLAFLHKDFSIKKLNNNKGEYWADPFMVNHDQSKFIFFEEIPLHTNKGIISLLRLDQTNIIIEKKEILNKPFHLSFPNVFLHNQEYYMLPEQIESNQLTLYKATNFPYDWVEHHTIFKNKKAIDPSLVFHEGLYYLFTNIVEEYEYDNNERMSVFYTSDVLSGNWQPHAKNPVKIDKTSTRNAGNIYFENNEMIRLTQNCDPTYGFSTKKMKISKLSPTEFEEIEIEHMKFKNFEGNHTYSKADDLIVVDILVKE